MMLMTTDYLLYAGAESGYSGMTDPVMKLLVYIGLLQEALESPEHVSSGHWLRD